MNQQEFPHIRRLDYQGKSLGDLPPEPDRAYYELDPNVRLLWMVNRIFSWLGTFLGLLGLYLVARVSSFQFETYVFYAILALALPAIINIFWQLLSYRYWGVSIRSSDLVVRRGVLWKHVMCIPFARIQHVDTQAGPLERAFGVANLAVFTAGSQLGAMSIPGLPTELAQQLRDFLSHVGHQHANL